MFDRKLKTWFWLTVIFIVLLVGALIKTNRIISKLKIYQIILTIILYKNVKNNKKFNKRQFIKFFGNEYIRSKNKTNHLVFLKE